MQRLENSAAVGMQLVCAKHRRRKRPRNQEEFAREDMLYIISSEDGEIWEEEDNKVKTFH